VLTSLFVNGYYVTYNMYLNRLVWNSDCKSRYRPRPNFRPNTRPIPNIRLFLKIQPDQNIHRTPVSSDLCQIYLAQEMKRPRKKEKQMLTHQLEKLRCIVLVSVSFSVSDTVSVMIESLFRFGLCLGINRELVSVWTRTLYGYIEVSVSVTVSVSVSVTVSVSVSVSVDQ